MCFINHYQKFNLFGYVLFAVLILALPNCYAQSEQATENQFQENENSTSQIQNFNVINKSGINFIKWTQTPTETDCLLTVERSENGSEFVEIGSKKGFKSGLNLFYSFIDDNPISFVSYYKIKYTDSNGYVSYSEIKQIENIGKQSTPNNNLSTASLH